MTERAIEVMFTLPLKFTYAQTLFFGLKTMCKLEVKLIVGLIKHKARTTVTAKSALKM